MLDRGRWEGLCGRLACSSAAGHFEALASAYDERHRHYHASQHIAECLALFDSLREGCVRPDEVEFGIWLHDAVYETRGGDNEERSADLAVRWLHGCGGDDESIDRVRRLILSTRHDGLPQTDDERILVDIDLHILGASPERFDEYEEQVRAEYRWVPGPLFRRRRADILRAFLDRDRIYSTLECRARFEESARANLARSLRRLGRSS